MLELKVSGMTCNGCAASVTRAIRTVDVDASVQVDLPLGLVRVEGKVAADDVISAIGVAGYEAKPAAGEAAARAPKRGCCCG